MSVNYHSLSDFRKDHVAFLDQLLTDGVATLLHEGLVQLQRVAQDGMRVRANAGASSFRREPTLQACLQEAEQQVAALRDQVDEDGAAALRRQQAAQQRAATERQQRIERLGGAATTAGTPHAAATRERGQVQAGRLHGSTTDRKHGG